MIRLGLTFLMVSLISFLGVDKHYLEWYLTMEYKLSHGAHSVHALQYHLIQCVKYRRKVLFDDKLIDLLYRKVHDVSKSFDVEVVNVKCDKDHMHLLFRADPTLNIPKYLNTLKIITAREIRENFPEVKKAMEWLFLESKLLHSIYRPGFVRPTQKVC